MFWNGAAPYVNVARVASPLCSQETPQEKHKRQKYSDLPPQRLQIRLEALKVERDPKNPIYRFPTLFPKSKTKKNIAQNFACLNQFGIQPEQSKARHLTTAQFYIFPEKFESFTHKLHFGFQKVPGRSNQCGIFISPIVTSKEISLYRKLFLDLMADIFFPVRNTRWNSQPLSQGKIWIQRG